MASAEAKRAVFQGFQANGFFLDKEAHMLLSEFVYSMQDIQAVVSQLIDAHITDGEEKIDKDIAQELISRICGNTDESDYTQIIGAFDIPRIKFDTIRRAFYLDPVDANLFGHARDKQQIYIERLSTLQQRLARNPLFNRPVFAQIASRDFVEVTEIKALLGNVGEIKTVMGFISQLEDGRYFLEDLSGNIPIDLDDAVTAAGFYLENCIVAAEGKLQHDGKFKVQALGMPPNERRDESLTAAKGLDFFGGQPLKGEKLVKALEWEANHEDDRIILLSDMWLDKAETLVQLDVILSGFESLENVPSIFVFMGNFHSYSCSAASTNYKVIQENFTHLGQAISKHPRITENSKLVFVPGTNDPGPSSVLPRPSLPKTLTKGLREAIPNAILATNPCHIRHYSQELIIFRDDLQKRMRRLCLRPPVEGTSNVLADLSSGDRMFEHAVMTITQQSHLCPLPLDQQAVYWQFDHALRVYPLPHALILADSSPASDYTERKSGCICINPGSMRNGTFAAYNPSRGEAELCEIPEQEA